MQVCMMQVSMIFIQVACIHDACVHVTYMMLDPDACVYDAANFVPNGRTNKAILGV